MERIPRNPRIKRIRRREAFSLVESIICIFVVAMMIVSGATAVGTSARLRRFQASQSRGMSLASQLLADICQLRYADPIVSAPLFGPEPGEARTTFNDVDDFDKWSESPPIASDGTPLSGYTGWSRSVSVQWVSATNPSDSSNVDNGLKRITVTVTSPTGARVRLSALRSAYDSYEKSLTAQSTYTNRVDLKLQVGTDSTTTIIQSVTPQNLVP